MEQAHKLGRYEIAGHLASGGMAEVLLARVAGPSGFERVVVLKRILPHLARQSSFVDMFLDEARIIARIHHPNVVDVHELGTLNDELFMVMEYLEGESASSVQRRLVSRHEPMPPRLAAFVVAEACAGLHAAHELQAENGEPLGVVHRDVSPQNIFITFGGAVKVIDFGIAKAADRIARTEAGDVKGKLEYMSPEQCRSETIDRRTDVFALGVVLYELLAQRRLFKRPSPAATIKAVLSDPIVPPSRVRPDVPASLDAICMRALEREKNRRYESALEMRRALVSAIGAMESDRLPEEDLAALMTNVLADRRREKEEMLARIREGSSLTALPSPEAEMNVDIPIVDATFAGTSSVGGPRRTRWGTVGVALIAVGVALGAAAFYARTHTPTATTVTPVHSAPEPTASAGPAPSASAPVVVHVAIESDPIGATITIDGAPMGTTPTTLDFPRGAGTKKLVLHKVGFADDAEDLSTDVDQKARFSLKPARTISVHRPPAAHGTTDQPPAKW